MIGGKGKARREAIAVRQGSAMRRVDLKPGRRTFDDPVLAVLG